MERNSTESRVLLDLSAAAVRAKMRPLVITVAFLMLFVSVAGVLLTVPLGRSGYVDFRHLYTAGYMVRSGHAADVYDYALYAKFQSEVVGPAEGALPFNHLAYEALVYAPFSFLSYRYAYFAFFAVNLLVLVAAIRMIRPRLSALALVWPHFPTAIVVCFLPVAIALIEGQDSLILLALFAAAITAWYAEEDFKSGVLVGLTLFKFQYAVPIVLLFMIWRCWRFFAGFAISGSAVVGISVWLTGASGFVAYVKSLIAMSAKYSSANGVLYGIHPDGMPNLRGIAYMLTSGSVTATHWIVLAGSAVVMVWAALKRPSLPVALLAAMLVSYHQVIADSSLLALPVGLIMTTSVREISTRKDYLVLVLAGLLVVAPTVLLFANTRFYLLVLPVAGLFWLWDGDLTSTSPKVLKN